MARFSGTNREFKRYIGPQLRNLVQQITRSHRRNIGACQHCGATTDLESAHVAGRDRNQIIDHLLKKHTTRGLIEVDLVEFEQAFKEEHHPLEKSILILCSSCHRKYDGSEGSSAQGASKGKHSAGQLLPISLSPSEPEEFKRKLLSQKKSHYRSALCQRRSRFKSLECRSFRSHVERVWEFEVEAGISVQLVARARHYSCHCHGQRMIDARLSY